MAAASGALRGHVGPLPNKQLQSPVRASAVRDRRPTIAAASKDHLHAAERRENLGEGFESGVGPMHSPLSAQATHGGSMQRRHLLAAAVPAAAALAMLGPAAGSAQAAFACPGMNGYALQQCLREARKAREQAEAEAAEGESVEEERQRLRQYEQPGTLVTLPSGVQYREIEVGSGTREAALGSTCEIQYTVYRLSSGAYYKYSSGGTPVLLWALGSGFEGQDDLDEVYRFRLGDAGALPAAATPAVVGMRAGGRRRILIPPRYGWVDDKVGPRPPTFGGQRRLAAHRDEPLLFEVQLVRASAVASSSGSSSGSATEGAGAGGLLGQEQGGAKPGIYRLPAPPSPFKKNLGE